MNRSAMTLGIEVGEEHPTLRLHDEHGSWLAAHEVNLAQYQNDWHKAFGFALRPEDLPTVSSFLGKQVLGPIAGRLASGVGRRELIIQIDSNIRSNSTVFAMLSILDWKISAGLARVPWELALAPDGRTLRDHNIAVSVAPQKTTNDPLLDLGSNQTLRVLLVFADGSCSRALREALRKTLFQEILPTRNIEFDMMTIGVTAESLYEKVQRGGYHILFLGGSVIPDVHTLAKLMRVSGSPIPLVVLADTSQNAGSVFHAAYAGSALAEAGAHQVVTTRWPISLAYAVPWCSAFFKALLSGNQQPVSYAVALATSEVLRKKNEHGPLDHAAFVALGDGQVEFCAYKRRSKQMDQRDPKPTPLLPGGLRSLDRPEAFHGRDKELRRLMGWMDNGGPIMVLRGPENTGKTMLAAEATHLLWGAQFDFVLAAQGPVRLDDLFRHLHGRLLLASRSYRERYKENTMEAVYLDSSSGLTGADRYATMTENLLTVLRTERVLLILDGIQGSWLSTGEFCDRAVEDTLRLLADRLMDAGSRILITTQRWPTDISAEVMEVEPFAMSDAMVVVERDSEALVVGAQSPSSGALARR